MANVKSHVLSSSTADYVNKMALIALRRLLKIFLSDLERQGKKRVGSQLSGVCLRSGCEPGSLIKQSGYHACYFLSWECGLGVPKTALRSNSSLEGLKELRKASILLWLFQQTEQTKVREGKELPGQSPRETRSQPAGVLSPWNCVLQAMSYNDIPAVSPAGGAHEPRSPGF